MAKTTQRQRDDVLKTRYLSQVQELLSAKDEEVLRTGSNEIAFPVVDAEGNERWMVVVFKIPTGDRDGNAYDGYEAAQDYEMKLNNKATKAKEKEAKAAKDKTKREAKKQGNNGENSVNPYFLRFCTYCGGAMGYFVDENGHAFGKCKCGNHDYCENWPTIEEAKEHYKNRLVSSTGEPLNPNPNLL